MPRRQSKKSLEERAWEADENACAYGYVRGQYAEADKLPVLKANAKTKAAQIDFVNEYLSWQFIEVQKGRQAQGLPAATWEEVELLFLKKGVVPPSLEKLKDFVRWHATYKAYLKAGRIVDQVTVDSLKINMESFFAGFYRKTEYDYPKLDRSTLYSWIKYELTKERLPNGDPLVVDVHIVKYNLLARDGDRILQTIWTHDDLVFTTERHRVNYHARMMTYCETAARLSALDNILWRDIQLVLHWGETGNRARWIYRLWQREVKNNPDPKHIKYGSAHQDDPRLIYNSAILYLMMAVADGVLAGDPSIDQLIQRKQEFQRGDDALPLKYKPGMEDLPVYRSSTLHRGLEKKSMTKAAFLHIHRHNVRNAGYIFGASLKTVRRAVGAAVNARYTEAERCQLMGHQDTRIFGQSYVGDVAAVDGRAAFLDEKAGRDHIDYFQSIEQFRRTGLPVELPAAVRHQLEREDVDLRRYVDRVKLLQASDPDGELVSARQRLQSHRARLYRSRLDQYQREWADKIDQERLSKPRMYQAGTAPRTEGAEYMSRFIPERGRIAQAMVTKAHLSDEELRPFMYDLVSLCRREQNVLYLPSLEPVKGKCPTCRRDLKAIPRRSRNSHLSSCRKKEVAKRAQCAAKEVHHCYLCFDWVAGLDKWQRHCAEHLQSLQSKWCAPKEQCYTVIRMGYCPLCMGNIQLAPAARLRPYRTARELWAHIDDHHFTGGGTEIYCRHPLCTEASPFRCTLHARYHLIDVHRLPFYFPGDVWEDLEEDEAESGDGNGDGDGDDSEPYSNTDSNSTGNATVLPRKRTSPLFRGFKAYTPRLLGHRTPSLSATMVDPAALQYDSDGSGCSDRPSKRCKLSSMSMSSDAGEGVGLADTFLQQCLPTPPQSDTAVSEPDPDLQTQMFREFTYLADSDSDDLPASRVLPTPLTARGPPPGRSQATKPKIILRLPKDPVTLRLKQGPCSKPGVASLALRRFQKDKTARGKKSSKASKGKVAKGKARKRNVAGVAV